MSIAVGDRLPDVDVRWRTEEGVRKASLAELGAGKTLALFGVPGAFTSTCSDVHLPGFLAQADALRAAGADEIACVSVNDADVMAAWGRQTGAAGHVLFWADGNGELARAAGLELDLEIAGMGRRLRRFALVSRDGVVEYLGVEAGRDVGVSSAAAVLEHLSA